MKLDIQRFAVTYTGPEVVGNYSWAKLQGRVTCEETYVGTSAENKSTVKCTVEVRCTTGGTQAANWRMGVTCNGVTKTAKSTYNMTVDSAWKVINTVVFENVPHNEDGSKVVAISGYAQAPEYATSLGNAKSSFSGNMTLTTIPRESSISADKTSLTLDETVRININRKSSTFYEDLLITYVSGDTGKTTTETVKVTDTYYDLKLTSDKFKNITGPYGAITITAITYDASGNRVAQTNQVSVSVTIPNTMVPTLTVGDLYEDGTIVPSSWGVFVKGKSEIGVPVSASGVYGSTIKNITMRDSNTTGEYVITSSSGIFSTAKVVADGTLTFTATDSRDKTAKVTKNYTVVDYSDPKLTEYTAKKVNGNNIEDENGQYVMFSIGGTIADCAGNNVKKLYVAINNQTNWIDVTNNPTNSTITSQTIDPNTKNVVYFKITDSLGGSDIKLAELDSVFKLLNFNKTLTSVAIGKKSSAVDNAKLFEVGMPTVFEEGFRAKGNTNSLYSTSDDFRALPSGSDSLEYWSNLPNGTYWYSNTGAVPNMPSSWGFVEKTGLIGGDFNVMFYTQASGSLYRKSGNANSMTAWVEQVNKSNLINLIYPVGSIYMSVNNVSPQTFLGGTWEALKDRFLIGAGGSYTVNATGGSTTHTLTVDEIPSHSHLISNPNSSGSYPQPAFLPSSSGTKNTYGGSEMTTRNTGGGKAHSIMPPYLAVYMWKRTA